VTCSAGGEKKCNAGVRLWFVLLKATQLIKLILMLCRDLNRFLLKVAGLRKSALHTWRSPIRTTSSHTGLFASTRCCYRYIGELMLR
jgi:hypothetical protein